MSPEQCLGGEVTAASDQYSLGIMAYELLTGNVPFTGTLLAMQLGHVERTPSSPREFSDAVPQDVSDVVMRMIEKEPTSRWPSLAAAASALAHHAGANDSAMRRRMAELVAEVPDTVRKSFPATPRTPMPTAAPLPSARPREATTAPVPTLIDGPGGAVTPVVESKDAGITVATRPWVARQRRGVMIGAAAVVLTIIGAVVALSGGRGTPGPVTQGGPSDSVAQNSGDTSAIATRRAAAVAREDSLLDVVDTTVARILIRPGTVALAVGDSVRLAAAIYSGSGDELTRRVRWTSSDTTIVRVNADGWIFGLAKPKGQNEVIFITASAAKKEGLTTVRLK
jgi:serine/threonine-protein kinase